MMKKLFTLMAMAAVLLCSCEKKDKHLTRDLASFDQSLIDSLIACSTAAKGTNEIEGVVIIKDGKIVGEKYDIGYDADHLFILWSGSKTFNACAVGFAQQEGLLDVDDPIVKYFPEYKVNEACAEWWSKVTIRHILCMGSGLPNDFDADLMNGKIVDGVERFFSQELFAEPGTSFRYNSLNSYVLSALVTRVTGQKVNDYLETRLFEPLGIRRHPWKESAEGYNFGGYGLYLTTESFAKMGQFYLQKGVWNGKRLLEEKWFDEAMKVQILQYRPEDITTDEQRELCRTGENRQGYGFQMWHCTHNAWRLDGAYGQFSIIIPDKNAVVAINEHSGSVSQVLRGVWKYIYPAL